MPEIVRCSACRKETYAGLAQCPHCGAKLVPLREAAAAEPEAAVAKIEFSHRDFVQGLKDGRLGLAFDEERIKGEAFYGLMPELYARQIAIRFVLLPVAAIGGIVALHWADSRVEEELLGGQQLFFVAAMPVLLIIAILVGFREWAVKRRMLRDEAFYRRVVGGGFVRVVKDRSRPGDRPW